MIFTPGLALVVFVALLMIQRLSELVISTRNASLVKARGAREYGAGHYPWLVLLHVFYPVALVSEVLLGARPGPLWPLWLLLYLGAQALRFSAMRALGDRWNTRILVIPGAPLVKSGPYRWLRHPNYLAVVIEVAALPLAVGAVVTAAAASLLNLALLAVRIRCEEEALGIRAASR